VLILAILILLGSGARQMASPFPSNQQPAISLSPAALPLYALRTTIRMLAALVVSLVFTFTYATAAGKSRRAEMVLIPLLDVLQSVPVLGYLSFTVLFFVSLLPGTALGPELAAIFAIFTAQGWNMAVSFYQALITILVRWWRGPTSSGLSRLPPRSSQEAGCSICSGRRASSGASANPSKM
jgi:NitT/TauT family transport system permease protein